ncbi:MAG: nuclease-related domain-containing protein [Pseudohongiellaceae bacterium]|nr:nuclease-related domain-containing protein [Pseudohongiellaceae bacterium]
MEVEPQFIALLKAYWWFIPLLVVSCFFSSTVGKGLINEWRVRLSLSRSFTKPEYRQLHDLSLPGAADNDTIDHLIISAYGVFIIETRHMRGWIYGNEDQPFWTQKSHKKSLRFANPLLRNQHLSNELAKTLGLDNEYVHHTVCFIDSHRFKTPMPENVTSSDTILSYIRSFNSRVLTDRQTRELYQSIRKSSFSPNWKEI